MAQDNNFEMPDMRAFAEKSVEQMRTAFDGFLAATQKAVNQAQTHALSTQGGVREMSELAMRYTQRNIAASFEFAQKLAQAKDAKELAELNAEYIRRQMEALTEQAQELGRQAAAKLVTPKTSS
jgi:phasin